MEGTPHYLAARNLHRFAVIWKRKVAGRHVNSGQSATHYSLSLRPPGRAWAPYRSPSAGAALPHKSPELFAQGHTGPALRELATGPQRKLAGPLRLSRKDNGI